MRRTTRLILLALAMALPSFVGAAMGPIVDGLPVLATMESSLGTSGKQIRQFAFDADRETFFASAGNPTGSDHFTMVLDKAIPLGSIEVTTGRPDGVDPLEDGSLEVSDDGRSFEGVAQFGQGGVARVEFRDRAIRAVRIKPGPSTSHPPVIREIALGPAEPVATFVYPVEFAVDMADAPEMKEWADRVARLCERWYPRLNERLKSEGYKPPTQVMMTLKSSYRGVAMAGGNRITGSVAYFEAHPDDLGAMIHETCHVIQRYRGRGNPGLLVEGIADHVRFFDFEPGQAGPVDPSRAHYNDSYRTTASFLDFVSNKYDKSLVLELNRRLREGKYNGQTFPELTGKTLAELDAEWLASLAR